MAVFASSAFCLFLFPPALLAEVAQGLIGFWFSSTCLNNSLLACLLGMGHFGTYAVTCLFIATCLFATFVTVSTTIVKRTMSAHSVSGLCWCNSLLRFTETETVAVNR